MSKNQKKIASWRSRRGTIEVELQTFRGRMYASVRRWIVAGKQMIPTRSGITLDGADVKRLRRALRDAKEAWPK